MAGNHHLYFVALFLIYGGVFCYCDKILPGLYKIENAQDHLYLTTQGSNTSFATVVGDAWQNFGEQRWELTKLAGSSGFHLTPLRYKSNNFLSYYRDVARKHPIPESWLLVEINPSKYQMQNQRTKLCLASTGRRRIVIEAKCDRHLRIQQWEFKKI